MTIRLKHNETKQKVSIIKLSMSVPAEMKPLIRQRAASLDLSVSQLLRKLVNEDLKSSG